MTIHVNSYQKDLALTTQKCYIILETQTGTTTPGQNGPESNGRETIRFPL